MCCMPGCVCVWKKYYNPEPCRTLIMSALVGELNQFKLLSQH